ncbi:NADH flavin oxidoreductase/12-oxophytodienoate reductase [Polyplosphaeria fusca]|uniref:NADH flavin oxidoreductase/12-oxophytodienoate reductase n=1 Tax=Polyplosphaeria fusca TaxID=682080 RepID=A0A9P4UVN6_9PLEO|nr:NADH flavin oxidoreductase/12-oxophytodienoate reductase [Polyplosphaeria fusca]
MADITSSKLFQPLKIGNITLNHRIYMTPLSRFRVDDDHVPLPMVKDYYAQRASVPGTLVISEATLVSTRAGLFPNMPGIWSDAQIAAWKEVVDAVHAKGSYMFLQLVANGRTAPIEERAKMALDVVGPSPIPFMEGATMPREMTEAEIFEIIEDYANAAKNAIHGAGFDGVEIMGGNGHLIDQFIQDVSNKRTDAWGGSIENRARFPLEIAKTLVAAVGKERVGIRFSPFSRYLGMKMVDPLPQYLYLVKELRKLHLMHLHLIEPRIDGDIEKVTADSNDPLIEAWGNNSPVLLAGGYNAAGAQKAVEEQYKDRNVAIGFGRFFIANPDLVFRIQKGIEFNKYDRSTFYDTKNPHGYIDYPLSAEWLKGQRE